jgi:hypothetical protein
LPEQKRRAVTKQVARLQQEQKLRTRTAETRDAGRSI